MGPMIRLAALAAFSVALTSFSAADTVNLTLSSANNYVSPDGAYVAPYVLQVTGTNQTFQVICDDYTVDVVPGDQWQAQTFSLSNLGTTGDSTRFFGSSSFANTTSATVAYDEAAWLAYKTGLFGGPAETNQQISDLNYAIWYLFDPSGAHGLSSDAGYTSRIAQISGTGGLLDQALAAVTTQPLPSYFSQMIIYTPTCNGQTPCNAQTAPPNSQEYITFRVPEPGTLALVLLPVAGVALRKRLPVRFRKST